MYIYTQRKMLPIKNGLRLTIWFTYAYDIKPRTKLYNFSIKTIKWSENKMK
jgi:hypothetical protein